MTAAAKTTRRPEERGPYDDLVECLTRVRAGDCVPPAVWMRRQHGTLAAWRLGESHECTAMWITADRLAVPLRVGPEGACMRTAHARLAELDVADLSRRMPVVIIAGQRRTFAAALVPPLLGVVDVCPGESVLLGIVDHTFVMVHVRDGRTTLLAHDAAALGEVNADRLLHDRRSSRARRPGLRLPDPKTLGHLYRLEHGSTAPPDLTRLARKYVRIGLQRLPDRIPKDTLFREAAVFVAGFLLQIASGARDFYGDAPTLLADWVEIDPTFEARLLAAYPGKRPAAALLARALAVLAQHTSLVVKEGGRTWRIRFAELTDPNSKRFAAFVAEISTQCCLDEAPEAGATAATPEGGREAPPGPHAGEAANGATTAGCDGEDERAHADRAAPEQPLPPDAIDPNLLAENRELRKLVRSLLALVVELRSRSPSAVPAEAGRSESPSPPSSRSPEGPTADPALVCSTEPAEAPDVSGASAWVERDAGEDAASPASRRHLVEQNLELERLARQLSDIVLGTLLRAARGSLAPLDAEALAASPRGPPAS